MALRTVELTDEQRAANYAAPRQKRDRSTDMPGGMECDECGGIFIGDEGHSYCALCVAIIWPDLYGRTALRLETAPVTEKLLPCPFCAGTDIRMDKHHESRSPTGFVWSMCCYKCGATFPNRYKRELLVENWNRRPAGPEQTP